MRFLAVLIAVALSIEAQAASLRTMTTLHGPNVYLSDLFDDAGRNANRLLGPGPMPGGRIVVEAPQLDAIARQYDVAWRSISQGDRAVLEWPGRALPKDDVLDALRSAMTAAGATGEFDIEIPDFVPPVIPAEAAPISTVSQLDLDSKRGRFSAILAVTGNAMSPVNMRLSGRIEEAVEAPLCVTRLLPETIIRAGDVRMGRIRKTALQYDIARSIDKLIGMQLRRPVAAGMPIRLEDLVRPAMVQRGGVVRLELQANDLFISGQAVALEAGAAGDVIRVQPKNSAAVVLAQVVSPEQVRVFIQPNRPNGQSVALQ
jgi:flagellar basal body P-ring formation protein FlgA